MFSPKGVGRAVSSGKTRAGDGIFSAELAVGHVIFQLNCAVVLSSFSRGASAQVNCGKLMSSS